MQTLLEELQYYFLAHFADEEAYADVVGDSLNP
jgi:hemerythrin